MHMVIVSGRDVLSRLAFGEFVCVKWGGKNGKRVWGGRKEIKGPLAKVPAIFVKKGICKFWIPQFKIKKQKQNKK